MRGRLHGKPCDRPEASGPSQGFLTFKKPWSSCRVNWKFGIARGRAFPVGGLQGKPCERLALVVFFAFNLWSSCGENWKFGIARGRAFPEGRLQGKPCERLALVVFFAFNLWSSCGENWKFGIARGRAFPGGEASRKALLASLVVFFAFNLWSSCGENWRFGIARGRAFPGGEASRKALLASLVVFFVPFPRPSTLGSVRERKSPATSWLGLPWRRGRDSNPRYPCGHICFRDRPDRPLWHLSGPGRQI